MILSSWVAAGLASLAIAGGAGAAAVVIATSGPAAHKGGPDNQQVATATPTATPTTVATPTPAATATPNPAPRTFPTLPAVAVGPDGWPLVNCGPGTGPFKAPTRKLSLCAPAGWRGGNPQEFTGAKDEPEGWVGFVVQWTRPSDPRTNLGFQIVSSSSHGGIDAWRATCRKPVSILFLGLQADACFGYASDPNGLSINFPELWRVQVFVEIGDWWLIVDAAGTDPGGPAAPERVRAIAFIDSARAASLERSR